MDEDLIYIRFEGELLETCSLPIYELGTSLIAIQRIVHKSALFAEGKLERGTHLTTKRRAELALQVSSHRKSSDFWGLRPYLRVLRDAACYFSIDPDPIAELIPFTPGTISQTWHCRPSPTR
jgi:hypothetical protein